MNKYVRESYLHLCLKKQLTLRINSLIGQEKPAQIYKDILMKLNLRILRNELVEMKHITKIQSVKYKKMQIISELCALPQEKISQRINKQQQKHIYQLQTKIQATLSSYSLQNQPFQQQNNSPQDKMIRQNPDKTSEYQEPLKNETELVNQPIQSKISDNIKSKKVDLNLHFKQSLPKYLATLLNSQKMSGQRIMDALYEDFLKKTEENQNRIKLKAANLRQNKNKTHDQRFNTYEQKKAEKDSLKLEQQNLRDKIRPIYKKPFLNRLFKTNEQTVVEEQRRKYWYEYEKRFILDQICSTQTKNQKDIEKSIQQIKAERNENELMKGFVLDRKFIHPKNYSKNSLALLYLFCGFNHYKQLLVNSHLVKYFYALTFGKDLPVEYTLLKISEEYYKNPKSFQKSIRVISKQHFLKFMRTCTNYIQKVFKVSNPPGKKQQAKNNKKSYIDDQFDDQNDNDQEEVQKVTEKQQKFPKSTQQIDLNVMKFSFSVISIAIQRVVNELNDPLFLQEDENGSLKLQKSAPKQLRQTHQLLMLFFYIFKNMESLFAVMEINGFEELNKLSKVLLSYHELRVYLSKHIDSLEYFMRKFDKHYDQKVELGLSSIITEKQLFAQNFILKQQARKLNFQITDNLASVLKYDNVEISLESKREIILQMLERYFLIYIQNDMLDSIEEELVYTVVRFLQKQVYLHKKVKDLFESRVNFQIKRPQTKPQRKENSSQVQPQSTRSGQIFNQRPQNSPNFIIQNQRQFNDILNTQAAKNNVAPQNLLKNSKYEYFSGAMEEFLSKQLLNRLITIIKYKHERKQIRIQAVQGFNLIQEWYSQPTVIRLQFLNEEIVQKFKKISLSS